MLSKAIDQCAGYIRSAKHVSVLTGAGISTSAGIPDFRGPQGLYVTRRYDPEKIFDIQYFYEDPKPFFEFARDFITLEKKLEPTFAHFFLAALEKEGLLAATITQNIDSLHQRAGQNDVIEVHGSFWKSYCLDCEKEYDYQTIKRHVLKDLVPFCGCGGVIKPDIVFFGEAVKHINRAFQFASESDLFFVIGSSCVVQPAAMIPHYAQGHIVVINLEPVHLPVMTPVLQITGEIDVVCKELAQALGVMVRS